MWDLDEPAGQSSMVTGIIFLLLCLAFYCRVIQFSSKSFFYSILMLIGTFFINLIIFKAIRRYVNYNAGFIYVFFSESLGADTYKVGRTYKHPENRARAVHREYQNHYGRALAPFKVVHYWRVRDYTKAEKDIHDHLVGYRISRASKERELFQLPLNELLNE